MEMNVLIWASIFGVFGATYFVYGKGHDAAFPKYCGIALVIFPIFISNLYIMIPLGVALMVLPFIFRE